MTTQAIKRAIITGASGGIGDAVAKRLATDGFAVALQYGGNAGKAGDLAAELTGAGKKAVAIQADVTKPTDVQRLFEQTIKEFGGVEVVVHCAGIMPLFPISEEHLDTFDNVIATNLRGAYLVLAQAAKRLPSDGRIIVFSTSVIAKSIPNYGAYIAAKSGVEGLVRVLANELRGRRISVNAVAPGPVATDLFLQGKTEERIKEFEKMSPLERLGRPEDIAGIVSFLAGPEGGWVNGQVVRVNGGFA